MHMFTRKPIDPDARPRSAIYDQLGVEKLSKDVVIYGQEVRVNLWDVPSQDRLGGVDQSCVDLPEMATTGSFVTLVAAEVINANGLILLYDEENVESFAALRTFLKDCAQREYMRELRVLLVSNCQRAKVPLRYKEVPPADSCPRS